MLTSGKSNLHHKLCRIAALKSAICWQIRRYFVWINGVYISAFYQHNPQLIDIRVWITRFLYYPRAIRRDFSVLKKETISEFQHVEVEDCREYVCNRNAYRKHCKEYCNVAFCVFHVFEEIHKSKPRVHA